MTIRGWLASSYYARTQNSASLVAMLYLACAPSYTRAQAPAGARTVSSGRSAAELAKALRVAKPGEVPALETELLAQGEAAVKPLIEILASSRGQDRIMAIIAHMGAKAPKPLVALLADDALRPTAARALAHAAGTSSADQAEELVACMSKYPDVKHSCGMALVRGMNPKQGRWVALLTKALKSGDRDERLYAALALKQISLKAPGVRMGLMMVVSDSDAEVRQVVRSTGLRPVPKPAAKPVAKPAAKGVQAK